MASITELQPSGEQDTLSLLGASAVRQFRSTVDNIDDDPLTQLFAEVPGGSQHPDPRFIGAISAGYAKMERLAPLEWIVEVQYRTPDHLGTGGSFNGWSISARFETTTESVGRSLPDYDKNGRQLTDGRLVGSHVYSAIPPMIVGPDAPTPYTTISPDTLNPIPLYRNVTRTGLAVAGEPIEPEPQPRQMTHLAIEFTKTAPRMTFTTLENLGFFANFVNDRDWHGFNRWTLMFTNCTVTEEVSTNDFGYTEFRYPITLQFTQKKDGWTPISLVETWPSATGKRSEIIEQVGRAKRVVTGTWPWYDTMNFDILFSLAGGSVGQSAPIQPTVRP